MTNSQRDLEIESMQSLEILTLDDAATSDELTRDRKSKLLHHLVDISRVLPQKPGAGEADPLLKTNAELINEILDWSVASEGARPIVSSVVWKDVLMQKLIDGKVNLADEKVKAFANQQLEATSKSIEALIDTLVRDAVSFTKCKGKVTFELQPKTIAVQPSQPSQSIYLRSLNFAVCIANHPINLTIYCNNLAIGQSCRTKIQASIKDQSGGRIWIRTFSKTFSNSYRYGYAGFTVHDLVRFEEYQDEALGLLRDGKLRVELSIRADELVETAMQTPATTRQRQVTAQQLATEQQIIGQDDPYF